MKKRWTLRKQREKKDCEHEWQMRMTLNRFKEKDCKYQEVIYECLHCKKLKFEKINISYEISPNL